MTFTVWGLTGYGYGLAAGAAALCYLGIAVWMKRKTRVFAEAVLLYGVLGIPLGLIVSRVFFCAVNAGYFFETIAQPIRMLSFWDGGFSMAGLLFGLTLAALLAAKIRKIRFGALLDAVTLPMGLLLFGLRLAEGFTGELGIGSQVEAGAIAGNLPFLFVTEQMGALELHRLAVYRYEAAFALIVFGLMLLLLRSKRNRREGDLSLLFFALYGAGQILFESMRDDGHMVLGFIRVQQVLALLTVLIVLGVFCRRFRKLRGARDAVTAAWTIPPLMAFVFILMVAPVNHVLDLSGHIPLGIGILALFSLYLAFFLRRKGASPRLILTWLIALLTVAACVMLEFSMDGSGSLLRDYALLMLCCAVLFLCPFTLWRKLTLEEADT
ncbi:MAG: prolipoprotein diacylglyceryl transferase family protein [Bacillota bacterium]